jgi:endonuclease/exonuclease/phosphatase family metal-dependent hydrolase
MALAANPFKRAPRFFGALFFACFFTLSCEKNHTPDWQADKIPPPAAPTPAPVFTPARSPAVDESPAKDAPLRFLVYNLQNYLRMEREVNGVLVPNAPKPEASISALVDIIVGLNPDVLGVAEIGSMDDAHDLRRRLADAGLALPNIEYTHGSDPVRRLALFSRLPITERNSVKMADFRIAGRRASLLRGFLDVTIDHHGLAIRFIGVHLKSKREVEDFDQKLLRHAEARLLREHLDAIFLVNPTAALLVYGDFNDTRQSPTLRSIQGNPHTPTFLEAINLKDSRGHSWTHYWAAEDTYSRIDFICVSRSLAPSVDRAASTIPHPKAWRRASDHRPLLLILR